MFFRSQPVFAATVTLLLAHATLFAQPGAPAPGDRDAQTLQRLWNGVQTAQNKYTTACGKITETRTSQLLARPLVLHGRFCAEGTTKFFLEYSEPHPLRLIFNEDYLNVSTGPGAKATEVLKIGQQVRRTQNYFSNEQALRNLKSNFDIALQDSGRNYRMKLVPRSRRFEQRVNYIVVEIEKETFLLRSLEVDGASGVNSVFAIDITQTDIDPGAHVFDVYRPK